MRNSLVNILDSINNNISLAYETIESRGGPIPDNKNIRNLSFAINNIPIKISESEVVLPEIMNKTIYSLPENWVNGATKIPKYFFAGCDYLHDVILPSSIEIIDEYAFHLCRHLTTLNIKEPTKEGEGLKTIANNALTGCYSLQELYIPSTCISIGKGVFDDCNALCKITVGNGNNSFISLSRRTSSASKNVSQLFCKKEDSYTYKAIKFVNGVKENEFNSYNYNNYNYIETFDSECFYNDNNIKDLNFSISGLTLNSEAVKFCNNLGSISLNGTNLNLNNNPFVLNYNLSGIYLSSNSNRYWVKNTSNKKDVHILWEKSINLLINCPCRLSYQNEDGPLTWELVTELTLNDESIPTKSYHMLGTKTPVMNIGSSAFRASRLNNLTFSGIHVSSISDYGLAIYGYNYLEGTLNDGTKIENFKVNEWQNKDPSVEDFNIPIVTITFSQSDPPALHNVNSLPIGGLKYAKVSDLARFVANPDELQLIKLVIKVPYGSRDNYINSLNWNLYAPCIEELSNA